MKGTIHLHWPRVWFVYSLRIHESELWLSKMGRILNNKPKYFQYSLKTWFDEAITVYGLFSAGL